MRALCVVLLVAAWTSAFADGTKVIDLDNDEDSAWRLAEAAGACHKRHPAFIKTWCHTTKPRKARFTKRYDTTASDAGNGKLGVTVPVSEHGKGFVSALVQPPVKCQLDECVPASTVTVLVRTKKNVTPADVRVVTFAFDVSDMWRDHQWWGPKPTKVVVALFDATGKQLGEGTLAKR